MLPLVSACKKKAASDEELIKGVIERYNAAMVDAYRRITIKPMEAVASEREVSKVNAILAGLYGEKIHMDSDLLDIRFEDIKKVSKERAVARVKEKWRWRHLHIETKKEVKPWVEEEQRLLYHLVKDPKKGWIVDSVEFVK